MRWLISIMGVLLLGMLCTLTCRAAPRTGSCANGPRSVEAHDGGSRLSACRHE
jgi:hypothetical protein